jgi:D-arabinono-1,4-lactone oxidase/FAD binding domain
LGSLTVTRSTDGFYHPKNEDEIIDLIHFATANDLKVRVRGSAHSSVKAAIYTGDFDSPPSDVNDLNIILDQMSAIEFDDEKMLVTVQGGCHFGLDPADPTGVSTVENSLVYQLQQHGWALPITGGIIHQTMGGFLSTGSSGGSLQYSLLSAIVTIRLIDGSGTPHDFQRTDDADDPFYAVGVSMGLLGIITSVTFHCISTFNIAGTETTSGYADCRLNLFDSGDDGRPSTASFFENAEYARMMWWPQKGIEKILIWEAQRIAPSPDFKPKPYAEFVPVLGSERPAQIAAGVLFRMFSILNPPGPSTFLGRVTASILKPLFPMIVNLFLASGVKGPQRFQDYWGDGVPMDNRVDYRLVPVQFSELWIPVSRANEVMTRIRDHFRDHDITQVGTFTVEVYPTPKNIFWMSPGYHEDVVKYDMFWFPLNKGNPATDFYPQFWELLKDFDFRPHWGKFLPDNAPELRALYPRWNDFMQLREQMDPHQIFVTAYWRGHLGILPE